MAISFSVKVAAEECGLSERTIHAAIKQGALKVMRVGRRVLITPIALEQLPQWQDGQEQGRCQVSTERLLTLMEVADMLRVTPHTVRRMGPQDRLRPVRICRRLLFAPDAVGAVRRSLRKSAGAKFITAQRSKMDRASIFRA